MLTQAQREQEPEAARQFAERALEINPKLTWPFDSLFELQCKASDWAGALKTLATGAKNGQIEKPDADRRRAVLLTAQAQALEVENGQKALDLALEAHNLAPDLVPAAAIAGRQLASRGSTPRAVKIIERTWKKSPHPDLSVVYAFARPGDSPRDRLEKIKRLARTTPHSSEGPIAIAHAAVDARNWDEARAALAPLLESRLSPRICTLMARIEGGEKQNAGGVREWLARAVTAPRDPAWTADGMISDSWAPTSPVTGALDAFQWKVPLEATPGMEAPIALDQLVEFEGLGTSLGAKQHTDVPAAVLTAAGGDTGYAAKPEAKEAGARKPAAVAVATDVVDVAAPVPARIEPADAPPGKPAPTVRVPAAKAPSWSPAAKSEASVTVEIVADTARPLAPAGANVATAAPVIVKAKPAPPVAVKPVVATTAASTNGAKPFVPPRAPDDPGLDESEEIAAPRADYVTKTPKRTTY